MEVCKTDEWDSRWLARLIEEVSKSSGKIVSSVAACSFLEHSIQGAAGTLFSQSVRDIFMIMYKQ